MDARIAKIRELAAALYELTDGQLDWLEGVLNQFKLRPIVWREANSDIVTPCVLEHFGDALQIHHCFSSKPLTKDSFEYVLERVLNDCNISAKLARRGNRGHDITIRGIPFSLKTQADRNIRRDILHVSKFMELGKGRWESAKDFPALRDQFTAHMAAYERILQLRRITSDEYLQEYELVEIPKAMLLLAKKGVFTASKTKQDPPPGYCTVSEGGRVLFRLYFDGGTERKLQIQRLLKERCIVHASWKIKRTSPAKVTL